MILPFGLYMNVGWTLLFLGLSVALVWSLYKGFRVARRVRNDSTRMSMYLAMLVVGAISVLAITVGFHDLCFSGQDYGREMQATCESDRPYPHNFTRAMVVARYKEDISWLNCPEYGQLETYVYNKGPPITDKYGPNVHLIQHENVGFECSAFLTFILDHYDDLPERVFFVHGFPYDHCTHFSNAFRLTEKYDFYMYSIFNWRLRRSGWPQFWPHQGFAPVFRRIWDTMFEEEMPEYLQTYFNGQFVVSRKRIHARPREFWAKAQHIVTGGRDVNAYSWGDTGNGWLECCAFERLWMKIFADVAELDVYPREEQYC